jgi:hypothetical protein
MVEARRPYVDRTHGNEDDALAMAYSKDDYESAPPTPAQGDRAWRSPVALVADDGGSIGSVSTKQSRAAVKVEPTPEELLPGMVATQMDAGLGQVIVLNLVGVELDFQLEELAAVFTPFVQVVNLGRNPGLRGDLSAVSDCVGLYDLCLERTAVAGDLASLAKCKKLHKVLLSDLQLTGDIAVFAPCLSLKKVWLRCTQVDQKRTLL